MMMVLEIATIALLLLGAAVYMMPEQDTENVELAF